jgi:hypothetical protein
LHVGIYAKSVVGRVNSITTYKAHAAIFTELSRLYIEENKIFTTGNSTGYNKIYGVINTNNSMITVNKVYYNDTEHLETDDGNFDTHFVSNLTEIRKCL